MIKNFRRVLNIGFALLVSTNGPGCARQHSTEEVLPATDSSEIASTEENDVILDDGFVDRRPEIDPTPEEVTSRRLRILHREIARFELLRDRLPQNLAELLTREEPDPNLRPHPRWLRDGWDREIRYEPTTQQYRLISAGSDGVFGNGDDQISVGPPG